MQLVFSVLLTTIRRLNQTTPSTLKASIKLQFYGSIYFEWRKINLNKETIFIQM